MINVYQYYNSPSEHKDIRKDSAESIRKELATLTNTSGKLEENVKRLEGLWDEINRH